MVTLALNMTETMSVQTELDTAREKAKAATRGQIIVPRQYKP
jgi:hypothetical protein